MAKAIAIIDIPDGVNIEECLIDYEVYQNYSENDYQEIGSKYMVNLRPLPHKKPLRQIPSNVLEMSKRKRDFIIHKVDVDNAYAIGYNDCVDDILGEQE